MKKSYFASDSGKIEVTFDPNDSETTGTSNTGDILFQGMFLNKSSNGSSTNRDIVASQTSANTESFSQQLLTQNSNLSNYGSSPNRDISASQTSVNTDSFPQPPLLTQNSNLSNCTSEQDVCDELSPSEQSVNDNSDKNKQSPRKSGTKFTYEDMSSFTIDDVEFSKELGTVTKIKNIDIDRFTNQALKDFLAIKLNVKVPKTNMSKGKLLEAIAHKKNSESLMSVLRANENEREDASKTKSKPKWLIYDPQTFYRIILVITSDAGKNHFETTRYQQSRKELDQQHPHKENYESLLKLYNNLDLFFNLDEKYLSETDDCEIGTNITTLSLCDTIDDWMKLKHAIDYMVYQYRTVRNNKNKSGNNDLFGNYTKGKAYLHYLHLVITERGTSVCESCYYPRLEDGHLLCSTDSVDDSAHVNKYLSKKKIEDRKESVEIECTSTRTRTYDSYDKKNKHAIVLTSNERVMTITDSLYGLKKQLIRNKKEIYVTRRKLEKETDLDTKELLEMDIQMLDIESEEIHTKKRQLQEELKDLKETCTIKVDDFLTATNFC